MRVHSHPVWNEQSRISLIPICSRRGNSRPMNLWWGRKNLQRIAFGIGKVKMHFEQGVGYARWEGPRHVYSVASEALANLSKF